MFELIGAFGSILILLLVVSFMVKEGIVDESPLIYIGVILFLGYFVRGCF